MSTDQNTPLEQEDIEFVPAGTLLKQKREALGLTQKQIADRLRLRVAIIQKIETNDFDTDQVATFTRGYMRSYAKAVGVDEKLVLGAIAPDEVSTQVQEQPMQSFSKKTNRDKHDSRIMKLTWGILVVIIGISSVWWFQNQQKDTLSEIAVNSDSEFESESIIEPLNPTIEVEAVQVSTDSSSNTVSSEFSNADDALADASKETNSNAQSEVTEAEQTSNDSSSVSEATVVVEKEEEIPVPDGLTKITLAFSGDCWIQIKDTNGKTLVTGIKKAGENLDLNGKAPFNVILGAPEQVSMTFASEPVDLSGYTSGKVARFTLP